LIPEIQGEYDNLIYNLFLRLMKKLMCLLEERWEKWDI